MFSLGIYDKLTPGPLTDGRFVAGTGTIDPTGLVGSIGGIQQKLAAAHDAGAEIFLVPADNCNDALSSEFADDMELVQVTAIDDAASSLEAFSSADTAEIPRCEG
jgi:PDZ domain-containing protein